MQEGIGHAAEEAPGHAAHGTPVVETPIVPRWALVMGGFAQLVLTGVVLVGPRREVLWAGAWSSAGLASMDVAAGVAVVWIVLALVEAALAVMFLALVHAWTRGRPRVGLWGPSEA